MHSGITRRTFVFASATTLLAAATGVSADTLLATSALPLGNWVLKSPDDERLQDIVLPSLGGLVCLGLPLMNDREQFQRVLAMQKGRDALRRLAPLVPHLDIERLKRSRKWQSGYALDSEQYSPDDGYTAYNIDQQAMGAVQVIVTHLFNKAGYDKYFAGERNGLDNRHGKLSSVHEYRFGGALATEFAERKAYEAFMNEAMPVIMAWSQSPKLQEDVYAIHELRLPPYSQQEGGFVFPMNPFTKPASGVINAQEKTRLMSLSNAEVSMGRQKIEGVLVTTSPDQAAVITKLAGRNPVYAVVKERSKLPENVDLTRPLSYEVYLQGPSIGVYSDTTFKTQILTIPLS